MLAHNKNALICDLAEEYQIYDWRRVPVKTLGILAAGLRHNSRVVMQQSGEEFPMDTLIMAAMADATRYLLYALTAKKGDNPPPSFVEALSQKQEEKEERVFATGADFDAARAALLKRINNG